MFLIAGLPPFHGYLIYTAVMVDQKMAKELHFSDMRLACVTCETPSSATEDQVDFLRVLLFSPTSDLRSARNK